MINYTDKYFDLELLRLSAIKLHEATENNRLRNIYNRLSRAKYLMNPVIVGRNDKDIILLDGANRYGSLKEIGCKMILAQVLDYKDRNLKLEKWNHIIYDFDLEKLKIYCNDNGLAYENISYSRGSAILEKQFHYLIAADINKDETILIKLSKSLGPMLKELEAITKLYFKNYIFDRSECDIKFSDLRKYTRKKGVLIIFPDFRKSHIVSIANNGFRLPAGISRHRIYNRVLHVMYEISKLMDDKNIPQKQQDLKNMLMDKIDKNKVRQYQESVIVFDE
ncbi:MAG: hypothetical protein ABIY50_02100 [Ignavibacteria bacterium]